MRDQSKTRVSGCCLIIEANSPGLLVVPGTTEPRRVPPPAEPADKPLELQNERPVG